MLKKLVISRVRSTSENADIFYTGDEIFLVVKKIFLVFSEKKSKFLFLFFRSGENLTFFLVIFR